MESGQGLAVRVLFAGACRGNFNKLLKRVDKKQAYSQQQQQLIFIELNSGGNMEEMNRFLSSDQKMPMKTYILGAYDDAYRPIVEKMSNKDCNIHCLGKSGILEMPNGLCIAFLGGVYASERFDEHQSASAFYTRKDIASLKSTVQSRCGDVDFFLTSEWPENIIQNTPDSPTTDYAELPRGSPHIAALLSVIRPRYHFTSAPPLFFSRPPYKNPDLGAGAHVTRFTSLCPFGNTTKQNLFALCLTPARFMTPEKLSEIPSDATEYPFEYTGERKRLPDQQVGRDAVVLDSSCTPLGSDQGMWTPVRQQSGMQYLSFAEDMFGRQQSPSHGMHGDISAVQRLLDNIGRGGALTSFVPQNTAMTLQTQESNSIDYGIASPMQQTTNLKQCSPLAYATLNDDCSANLMNFDNVHHDQSRSVDVQNTWATLAQNPQLLNAALSMGLLPSVPFAQEAINPWSMADSGISSAGLQQQHRDYHDFQTSVELNGSTETISESVISGGQTPTPTDLERRQLPAHDSKRFKRRSFEGAIIRDRRKTCFVSNLPHHANRDNVADHFSQAGEVVHVVKRLGEGSDATWAFVQYTTQKERNYAIKTLNRSLFADQEIGVSAAKDELDFDPNEPVNECWFCLGSPASDKALIVSVARESYVAIDKGPICDHHVLIIPISHYPNTLRMPESCYQEMRSYLRGLQQMFASQGLFLLAFERYLQIPRLHGNHTHISVVSIDETAAMQAKDTFIQRGRMQEGDWKLLGKEADSERDAIHDLVGDEEYILVFLPDGSCLIRTMLKRTRLPISFCRDVMAELVGIPERADWKVCLSSESEERSKVEKFRNAFSPFDRSNKS